MENNFIIRVTKYYWFGDVRLHSRQSFSFNNWESFCEYLALFRHDPKYMYEYFITSTTTPSIPFCRWSKVTRLPIGYNGLFLGLVYNQSDRKYNRYKKLF